MDQGSIEAQTLSIFQAAQIPKAEWMALAQAMVTHFVQARTAQTGVSGGVAGSGPASPPMAPTDQGSQLGAAAAATPLGTGPGVLPADDPAGLAQQARAVRTQEQQPDAGMGRKAEEGNAANRERSRSAGRRGQA